jgi:uncharacterized protein
MLIAPEFIAYASRQIARKLHPAWAECSNVDAVAVQIAQTIEADFAEEEALNEEVRDILDQYEGVMQKEGVSYMDMFKRIKRKLVMERKLVLASSRDTGDRMKFSRDKILDLSHKVITTLKRSREVRIRRDPNDVRLEFVKLLTEIMQLEEKVDSAARDKVRSLKRAVTEGAEEWDILHRRYYAEELKRFGIDLSK